MAGGEVRTPTVLWAQRKDRLFLTIDLPNVEAPKIHVADEGTLSFAARAGTSEHDKRDYAVELQFLHRVNAKDSKISVGSRNVVVMVMKAEEARRRPGKKRRAFGFCFFFSATTHANPSDRPMRFVPRRHVARAVVVDDPMSPPFHRRSTLGFETPTCTAVHDLRGRRVRAPPRSRQSVHRLGVFLGRGTRVVRVVGFLLVSLLPVASAAVLVFLRRRRFVHIRVTTCARPCGSHSGPHWPRLLKAPGKVPHVKTDFNKWVDEDEEDEMERGA